MIPTKVVESVGGKGFDTAVVLRAFDLDTVSLGFVAGETGIALVHQLERYGIRHDLVWAEGETRVALVIAEAIHQRHSHIIYGNYRVPPEALEAFFERYRRYAPQAKWIIGAGSLPQGVPVNFYHRIIQIAAEYGIPVLIDCPGQPALEAISASPKILKMNWDEFQRTFQVRAPTLEDLIQKAAEVYRFHPIPNFVITCGEHGVLAFTEQGVYLVNAPRQKAVNAAGAGDAVSAVLGWRLSLGEDWAPALKWAAATGAAVVLTEGTADCDPQDVERIYPQTTIQQLAISVERINS